MPIYEIPASRLIFPHPLDASEQGILGIGGDLSVKRLVLAYHHGIFPWYNEGEPILWWFPDPRCVLYPDDLHISRSLRTVLSRQDLTLTVDQDFEQVIDACRTIERPGQQGTWLHDEMVIAYSELARQGYAHSIEVWQHEQLVGGLYGLAIGKMFFGESMFSRMSNASKVALVYLVALLKKRGFTLIDCQQDTPHMRSMGASLISAETFYEHILLNQSVPANPVKWTTPIDWGPYPI